MLTHYLVTTKSEQGVKTDHKHFATIDEALHGASAMLGEGAPSVWIVDSDGNLVLPDDQVRVRLNLSSGTSNPAA